MTSSRRAFAHALLLCLALGCTTPEREPIDVQRGRAQRTAIPGLPPAPPKEEGKLDPGTVGLLDRLLAEPEATEQEQEQEQQEEEAVDERPLCLDLGFVAAPGPFRGGGHELPVAAVEAALSAALRASFRAGGPLAGPRAIDWFDLFRADDVGLPAVLEPPLPELVRERARALGGAYLFAARVERLEHEHVAVYSPERVQYEPRERGRVRLWFQLYELEFGSLVCTDLIDRRFALDELTPAQLASAELALATLAAAEIVAALERCLEQDEASPAR